MSSNRLKNARRRKNPADRLPPIILPARSRHDSRSPSESVLTNISCEPRMIRAAFRMLDENKIAPPPD